jgi:hypothetical protein
MEGTSRVSGFIVSDKSVLASSETAYSGLCKSVPTNKVRAVHLKVTSKGAQELVCCPNVFSTVLGFVPQLKTRLDENDADS